MLRYYLPVVLFFPLLPSVMGRSHLHIHALILFFSGVIFLWSLRSGRGVTASQLSIFIVFVMMQCSLLAAGALSGTESMAQLVSFFQPAILGCSFLAVAMLVNDADGVDLYMQRVLSVFSVLALAWAVCEYVQFDVFNGVNYFLYKRDDKDDIYRYATTFFGVSYYSGFAFLTIFCLLVDLSSRVGPSWLGRLGIVSAALCVFAAQSKVQILSLVIVISALVAIARPFLFVVLSLVVSALLLIFGGQILLALKGVFVVVVKSFTVILSDPSASGTLSGRLEQVALAKEGMMLGGVVGAGSGSGVYLESWVAEFLYRYGFLGVVYFFAFIVLALLLSSKLRGRGVTLWLFLLPLTQLSTASFLLSKTFFLSCLVFAYVLRK